jgi:hypothetical protein
VIRALPDDVGIADSGYENGFSPAQSHRKREMASSKLEGCTNNDYEGEMGLIFNVLEDLS